MKGMGFASSGGDEKAAAFGDALAESVLDEPDAEEQDVGGDDGEGGAGAGEDAANEKEEEEEEAPFDENLRPFCGSSLARSARSPAAIISGLWPNKAVPEIPVAHNSAAVGRRRRRRRAKPTPWG